MSLPEDNGKHVWARWATLRGKLAAALAERPKHPPTLLATAGLCEGESGVDFNTDSALPILTACRRDSDTRTVSSTAWLASCAKYSGFANFE